MSNVAAVPKTHNQPPVTIPKEEEMLASLQANYSEIDKDLAGFERDFATFPLDIPLEHADVAESLQDLIGKLKKTTRVWEAHAKGEKGPLNKLVKVVQNFFAKADERADVLLAKWGPVHEAYLDKKKADERRKLEAEAQKQREAADAARLAREKAEREAEEARAEAERQRVLEAQERERAAQAQRDREAAEERTRLAREKEKAEADAAAARAREEKEANITGLRKVRGHLKEAQRLNQLADAEEADDSEMEQLSVLCRPGGLVSNIMRPVAVSLLLTEEQRGDLESLREGFGALNRNIVGRADKKARAKLEKERKAEEAMMAAETARRRNEQAAEDARLAATRAEREVEEAAVARAKEEKKTAEEAARAARTSARGLEGDAKDAGREATRHGTDADRAENRADRVDNRLVNSSDADMSRTRGDLGTVGSLSRRWCRTITDEAALRAVLGPLGAYFTEDALEGATFHYMRARQAGFTGERVTFEELPGVVFSYEQEVRIA